MNGSVTFADSLPGMRPAVRRAEVRAPRPLMLAVGLLACLEPARRALRIHPTDVLKVQ